MCSQLLPLSPSDASSSLVIASTRFCSCSWMQRKYQSHLTMIVNEKERVENCEGNQTYFKNFLCHLYFSRIWRAFTEDSLHLLAFDIGGKTLLSDIEDIDRFLVAEITSFIRVSVWSISISPKDILLLSVFDEGKSVLETLFISTHFPAPATAAAATCLDSWPAPLLPVSGIIPGFWLSHLMSSLDI